MNASAGRFEVTEGRRSACLTGRPAAGFERVYDRSGAALAWAWWLDALFSRDRKNPHPTPTRSVQKCIAPTSVVEAPGKRAGQPAYGLPDQSLGRLRRKLGSIRFVVAAATRIRRIYATASRRRNDTTTPQLAPMANPPTWTTLTLGY